MPAPILYIPHGGGPMPLLGDPGHLKLIEFLKTVVNRFERPEAILIISAHWEFQVPALTAGSKPDLVYDYGGFPDEAYQITYPAPGQPELARDIAGLLAASGLPVHLNDQRGFDHGMFVPLKLMYPDADVPCLQLSLLNHLNAMGHIELGRALAPLRKRNVMVLGSGMSFHNLRSFFMPGLVSDEDNLAFQEWLNEVSTSNISEQQRAASLANWHEAPGGMACHPRPEHLLPLHVCYGTANKKAERIFYDEVIGKPVSGFLWE